MMRVLLVCVAFVGCSSHDEDGTITTGVSCGANQDRVCCQGDNAASPTCVSGEWRCPAGFPNFIPSAQCMTPGPYDTGTACDDAATDACEETISCPTGTAIDCPMGCARHAIERYDETRGCLVATDRALCLPPEPHDKCLGVASCRRNADGTLFRVPSTCVLTGYDFCAGAEDTKVLSATSCDGG